MNMKYTNFITAKVLERPTKQAQSFLHRLPNRHVHLVTTTTFFTNLGQLRLRGGSRRPVKPTSETHRRREPRRGFSHRAMVRIRRLYELHGNGRVRRKQLRRWSRSWGLRNVGAGVVGVQVGGSYVKFGTDDYRSEISWIL